MSIRSVVAGKREWKAMQARAHALPADYRTVYEAITRYTWKLAGGDGRGALDLLASVLDDFEAGAARGRSVGEVTGPDVAEFCDARMHGQAEAFYVAGWRSELNREAAQS